jgi:hypothetical protein
MTTVGTPSFRSIPDGPAAIPFGPEEIDEGAAPVDGSGSTGGSD